jgi:thiamine-monophosphate kinase
MLGKRFKSFSITTYSIQRGEIQDSKKLAEASNLKFEIHIDDIPGIKEFQKYISIDEILSSGEELELLFLSKFKNEKNLL